MKTILISLFIAGFSLIGLSQTNFVKYTGNPILPLGEPGEWDHNVAAFASVFIDDTTYHLWYTGNPGSNYVPQTGYATSRDGIHWEKHENNPILSYGEPGEFDYNGLLKPYVLYDNGIYKMWYVGGDFNRYYDTKIGYATSQDGITWNKHESNPVLEKGLGASWDNQTTTSPVVIRGDSLYQMWYLGRNGSWEWKEGYATSADGVEWEKYEGNPVFNSGPSDSWDDFAAAANCILYEEGLYYMFYHGLKTRNNGSFRNIDIGLATSTDGINWIRHPDNPILKRGDVDWDGTNTWLPFVIKDGHRWRMWYTGRNQYIVDQLGYAEDFSNAAHVDSILVSTDTVVANSNLNFHAYIANPHSENLSVQAVIKTSAGNLISQVNLKDSGNGIWTGDWKVLAEAQDYLIGIELNNLSADYIHNSFDWGVIDEFHVYSPTESPVPEDAEVELVADGIDFAEGPLWHPDSGYLLVSDLEGDSIIKINPQTKEKEVFLPAPGQPNGLALDKNLNLIMCRRERRDIARLEKNGEITVVAGEFNGAQFNGPNDLTVRSDSVIFFTDPAQSNASPPQVHNVYAIKPDGETVKLNANVTWPNGICLSPDETKLYISSATLRFVYIFNIDKNLNLTNKKTFVAIQSARFLDGMKVDKYGRLYVASYDEGVRIYSPEGKFIDKISIPQNATSNVTNINWGDEDYKTLYITTVNTVSGGISNVYKIRLNTEGNILDYTTNIKPGQIDVLSKLMLHQNHPNPFHSKTTIGYELPASGKVKLSVYNIYGKELDVLVNANQKQGVYNVEWNAEGLPTGIYFYRLEMDGQSVETRKMMLTKP